MLLEEAGEALAVVAGPGDALEPAGAAALDDADLPASVDCGSTGMDGLGAGVAVRGLAWRCADAAAGAAEAGVGFFAAAAGAAGAALGVDAADAGAAGPVEDPVGLEADVLASASGNGAGTLAGTAGATGTARVKYDSTSGRSGSEMLSSREAESAGVSGCGIRGRESCAGDGATAG
ncbi:MAG TPA: hypothetical protein VFI08_11765, partial [Spirochaetia bacterium]|nr:hypothetical protein [Spirochaetia bacterium]